MIIETGNTVTFEHKGEEHIGKVVSHYPRMFEAGRILVVEIGDGGPANRFHIPHDEATLTEPQP